MTNYGGYDQQTVPIPPGYKLVPDATGYRLVPDSQPMATSRFNALSQATKGAMEPSGLPGRMVNSLEEIRPNETPSDGTIAYFPNVNLQEIYAKQVGSNGIITDAKYVLEQRTESPAQNNVTVNLDPINARLDSIESAIKKLQNIWEPTEGQQKGE